MIQGNEIRLWLEARLAEVDWLTAGGGVFEGRPPLVMAPNGVEPPDGARADLELRLDAHAAVSERSNVGSGLREYHTHAFFDLEASLVAGSGTEAVVWLYGYLRDALERAYGLGQLTAYRFGVLSEPEGLGIEQGRSIYLMSADYRHTEFREV